MARKSSLSSTTAPGVYDGLNQAYSDSNAPASFEMTQAAEPPTAEAAEAVLWTPTGGTSLMMKNDAGVVTTIGPSAGGGGGGASGPELAMTTDYTTTTPSLPSSGLKLFSRHRARRVPAFVGPTGLDTQLQPAMYSNRVAWIQAAPNNGTSFNNGGTTANVVAPTAVPVTPATSFFAGMVRHRYSTTTAVGNGNGVRFNQLAYFMSTTANMGGFFTVIRFGINASTATSRTFFGMYGIATAPAGTVEPSTYVNIIGFGNNSADANMQFMHNDATGAATKVDLGANFPSKLAATNFYEARIFVPSGAGQSVNWSFQRINDGAFISSTTPVTTDLPALNTLLTPHTFLSNGTTGAIASLDFQSMYIETDN